MNSSKRIGYLLTTDKDSSRTIFSKKRLEEIGFDVRLVQHIPNADKVLSNKQSMESIYEQIVGGNDEWGYVFEDDINLLEEISLSEIIEYESYSRMFFYLGVCLVGTFGNNNIRKLADKIKERNVMVVSGNVRGLHAIGLSKEGAKELLIDSKVSRLRYMDMILEEYSKKYPALVVRFDLESYIRGHRGVIFQDRKMFPSSI